jgi:hypothetical protein
VLLGKALVALSVLGLLGCQSVPTSAEGAYVVTATGEDQPKSVCEGFRLTEAQVKSFFKRAKVITEKELHDEYEYLPCWVEGTVTKGTVKDTWRIRAIGIGEIRHQDGRRELVGCKDCDDLFQ